VFPSGKSGTELPVYPFKEGCGRQIYLAVKLLATAHCCCWIPSLCPGSAHRQFKTRGEENTM